MILHFITRCTLLSCLSAAAAAQGGSDTRDELWPEIDLFISLDERWRLLFLARVDFYDLKFIRSRPTETGRRVSAVTDRPIGFLEAYNEGRSDDYKFGIIILDLKTNKKGKEEGQGEMIYAAKVKVIDGTKLEIENFGIDPVRLMGVRKL